MAGEDYVREVYDASYTRLVVQVLAMTGELADAEDAVQEAFVRALGRGRTFARLDNPEAWLRAVAVNLVRNRWRHLEVTRRLRAKVPGPTPGVVVGPEHVALVAALARLDEAHRAVLVLHYLADQPVADIAREIGVPVGTVKSRLHRGRALLADLLADPEESDRV